MDLSSKLFQDKFIIDKSSPVINISNEIWLAFIQEIIHWKDNDIYAISFFLDYEDDNQSDMRLHFGYNTERQVKKELCNDLTPETVRWNYHMWLQNETFCFGEDGNTDGLINVWLKQQKIRPDEAITFFIKEIINAIQEIHKCGAIKERFGKDIPIIVHTFNYYENIAYINQKANRELLPQEFVDYCINKDSE